MNLFYDLHIHSCLSPCASEDMTPNNIVNMAFIKGLDVISVTDHNTCGNVRAVCECAKALDLIVIPGMEVQTKEEVHVLCYFKTVECIENFESALEPFRLKIPNNVQRFGNQTIMDSKDQIVGEYPHALILSLSIGLEELVDMVEASGGVAVPAHINKGANSLLSVLGFLPETLKYNTVEVFQKTSIDPMAIEGSRVLYNSDAHYLESINEPVHSMRVSRREVEEILAFIRGKGRR